VWDSVERVWGGSVQQVVLWWVCVGIVCVECGTVWSGFGEGVCSRWCVVGVCVCVL